jgi:hypothetical protein
VFESRTKNILGLKGIYTYLSLKALSGTWTRNLSNSRPVCFSYRIIFCAYFWIIFLISGVIVAWNMVWERWVESILYHINPFHFLKFVPSFFKIRVSFTLLLVDMEKKDYWSKPWFCISRNNKRRWLFLFKNSFFLFF